MQLLKEDTCSMAKKIELLEATKGKLLGDRLDPCSIDDLHQLENQLERSLVKIRARKTQLFREQIERLKEECGMQPLQMRLLTKNHQDVIQPDMNEIMEADTQLFIWPPERTPKKL
uniref:MADS53 n=1 Tax=Hippophae rhamnoides TaxID=193516 RepID=A0AAU7LJF1_9ROSA